jgi:hypothetical protein
MPTYFPKRITRRDFLKAGGITMAAALVACQRRNVSTGVLEQPTLGATVPPYTTPAVRIPGAGPSDLILKNGKVYTVDPTNRIAKAVAIKDGLIQAVGEDETITAMGDSATTVIDLGGRAVTPGLIDAHVHMRLIGLDYIYYSPFLPPQVKDISSLQNALAEVIKTKQPGEWINCYYLVLTDKGIPEKGDLDPVSPDNPVFLMHIGGHWATANTAALNLANVTSRTDSPPGGIIEMGDDGEPTGVLYNHRAMDVVRKNSPPITPDLIRQSILNTQDRLAAYGVTSFHDNNIRNLDEIQAYQDMSRDGSLFLRNDLYLTLEPRWIYLNMPALILPAWQVSNSCWTARDQQPTVMKSITGRSGGCPPGMRIVSNQRFEPCMILVYRSAPTVLETRRWIWLLMRMRKP